MTTNIDATIKYRRNKGGERGRERERETNGIHICTDELENTRFLHTKETKENQTATVSTESARLDLACTKITHCYLSHPRKKEKTK